MRYANVRSFRIDYPQPYEKLSTQAEKRNAQYILTESEEETFVQYILDLNSRRFSSRLNVVRSIADLLCIMYRTYPWANSSPITSLDIAPSSKRVFLVYTTSNELFTKILPC